MHGISYEKALFLCGGFGRFQYMSTTLLILAFMTGGQIVYGLQFLEDYPDYQCNTTGKWETCTREFICNNNLADSSWRIIIDEDNYKNWVDKDKLDLTCVAKELIGLMGSAYFLGFAISSGVTPYVADKFHYGRKKPYIASLLLQTVAYIFIFASKSIYFTIFNYLLVGLSAGGRVAIGTTYMNEFIPVKNQNLATTLLNVGDACIMIYQAIYYSVNKSWLPLHILGIIGAIIIICFVCLLPESPKYLYANYKFHECRQELKKIAKVNNSSMSPSMIDGIVFDTETKVEVTDSLNQETEQSEFDRSLADESTSEEVIKLTGELKEVCEIWQLRNNFISLMSIITISSFSFFLINFQMKKVNGSLITNTLSS